MNLSSVFNYTSAANITLLNL